MHNEQFLETLIRMNQKVLNFLLEKKLIATIQICLSCNIEMNIKKSAGNIDGYKWRCNIYRSSKYQHTKSIRLGFFIKIQIRC